MKGNGHRKQKRPRNNCADQTKYMNVWSEVQKGVTTKETVFWREEIQWHFKGTCRPQFLGTPTSALLSTITLFLSNWNDCTVFNINNNSTSIKLFNWFFRGIGHADMWEKCIYPGMRQSIICTLLASQEHMDRRRNCFELYGADFMLGEDFSPWLIEINSCPCMQPTTSVTARMCSQCLEDVIKGRLSTAANTTYKNYWHCLELHKCKYLLIWLKTNCRWLIGCFNKPTKKVQIQI